MFQKYSHCFYLSDKIVEKPNFQKTVQFALRQINRLNIALWGNANGEPSFFFPTKFRSATNHKPNTPKFSVNLTCCTHTFPMLHVCRTRAGLCYTYYTRLYMHMYSHESANTRACAHLRVHTYKCSQVAPREFITSANQPTPPLNSATHFTAARLPLLLPFPPGLLNKKNYLISRATGIVGSRKLHAAYKYFPISYGYTAFPALLVPLSAFP